MKTFRYVAMAGNAIFVLWIVWNGIDEGSRSTGRLELISLTGLILLLALNFILLWKQNS